MGDLKAMTKAPDLGAMNNVNDDQALPTLARSHYRAVAKNRSSSVRCHAYRDHSRPRDMRKSQLKAEGVKNSNKPLLRKDFLRVS